MILLSLISIGLTFALAWVIVGRLWRWSERSLLQGLLAAAPFIGLCSGLGMAEAALRTWPKPRVMILEIVLQAILVVVWHKPQRPERARLLPAPVASLFDRWAPRVFWTAFLISLAGFLSTALAHPMGGWDAWTIWNLRARFLLRAGLHAGSFSPLLPWSHPDYPLALPSAVIHLWWLMSRESMLAPIALASFFTYGTILLLRESVAALKGPLYGALAGLALLGTRAFLLVGLEQIADVPLAFLALSTMSVLALAYHRKQPQAAWIFAGLCAGLAAWTKNEGLAMTLVLGLMALWSARKQSTLWAFGYFMSGAALPLALVAGFKLGFAPANDLAAGLTLHTALEKITSLERWWIVARIYSVEVFQFGWHIIPAMLGFMALALPRRAWRVWPIRSAMTFFVLGMVGIYFGVFILSPHDPNWHIHSSLSRLFVQVWPSTLLIAFTAAYDMPG
jgi:hypothetical protein